VTPASGPDAARSARFTGLATAVQGDVLRYARRRADPHTAEEVLAETLVVLWRRLDDVPGGDATLPWCYAVARRCLANLRRGERRRLQLLRRVATLDPVPEVALEGDEGADTSHVHAALARLREDDREVLRLWAWEGLAGAGLGVALDVSPNAAAARLHRAKERLRDELDRPAPASAARREPAPSAGRDGAVRPIGPWVDGDEGDARGANAPGDAGGQRQTGRAARSHPDGPAGQDRGGRRWRR
jgi:RNA polymerase sigma-70 factor (ECF subfamily)